MLNINSLIEKEIDSTLVNIDTHMVEKIYLSMEHPNLYEKNLFNNLKHETRPLPCFMLGCLINTPKIYSLLNLDLKNVLLSRESIVTHQEIYAGQSLLIKTILKNAYEKQATLNPIGFVVLEIIGYKKSDVVFCCERILAVRGGLASRSKV